MNKDLIIYGEKVNVTISQSRVKDSMLLVFKSRSDDFDDVIVELTNDEIDSLINCLKFMKGDMNGI